MAALTVPLVFRRRAPMAVFLAISAVAFVQWMVTQPGIADASLLVALATVALESAWVLVVVASVITEAGAVMATARWVPSGNHLQSFVFLSGLVFAAVLAGLVVRALRSQLDWFAGPAERLEVDRNQQASLTAAAERSRIAPRCTTSCPTTSRSWSHWPTPPRRLSPRIQTRPPRSMREVSGAGRQALTDMRRMLGVLARRAGGPGSGVDGGSGSEQAPLAPQPGLDDLGALVKRVAGTGLPVTLSTRVGRSR